MPDEPAPIVVIGGGIGGLSAAIHLAAARERVILLEKNPQVGGKMGEVQAAGFRWDTGPSVITMRHVLEDLFAVAGRRLDEYLTLFPVEPLTRYFYPDGTRLDMSRDLAATSRQLAALDERDLEGYLAFLAYAARLHRITGAVFIYDRPPSLASFRKVSPLDYLKFDPFRTMHAAICSFVRTPRLRQLLGRFATYVGASPYRAPATLNVIAHIELTSGVWYPQGGVYRIAQAMERLASELGVEIRTNCPVERIEAQGRRVRGVILADGSRLEARSVIANVDVVRLYQRLLPDTPTVRARLKRLLAREPSCSGFILLLGMQGQHAQLAHHNIFFSSDYPAEFDQIFRRGVPAREPTIYVAITSKSDPDHAPPGCENWFILVNAPALGAHFDWDREASAYRDLVLARLAEFGIDVRGRLLYERILTPKDVAEMTNAHRGALYGASSNHRLAAFLRPPNRSPDFAGLYQAGGTAHPGGGVPMVILSGKQAAAMVLGDLAGQAGG